MLEACYPVVAVVNYAQRRATGDTAVGCVVKTRDGAERLVARRVGQMTNSVAIWSAIELALDATRDLGSALIFSCLSCTAHSIERDERVFVHVRDKAGEVKFRVRAKMRFSRVAFKYKRNDYARYELAHRLAQKALEEAGEIWAGGGFEAGKAVDVATQSPAEQRLLDAFVEFFPETCVHVVGEFKYPARQRTNVDQSNVLLVPQLKVTLRNETKHYYLDFAVLKTRVLLRRALCVEVDGTQYHTTPEAQAYDKQRDQDLRSEGWEVLRFTGAEVFRDARSCAERVVAEMGK